MVHRDPETGEFVSSDDQAIDLVYTDHEIVNFNFTFVESAETEGFRTIEAEVDDSVLGLQNDELGELGWMTARLTAQGGFEDPSARSAEAGFIGVDATVGSNLSGAEFLHSAESDTGANVISSDDGIGGTGSANDEPGIWSQLSVTCGSPIVPPDSGAAGGMNGRDRLVRRFHQETMGGPYVDASDDITVAATVDRNRNEEKIFVVLEGQMAFIVYEYEHRRAEFAPYGPGPTV